MKRPGRHKLGAKPTLPCFLHLALLASRLPLSSLVLLFFFSSLHIPIASVTRLGNSIIIPFHSFLPLQRRESIQNIPCID